VRRLIRSVLLLALAVAVVALLLWYGDAGRVASTISRFRPSYLVWYLLLLMAQEVARALLWILLLRALSMRIPLSTQIFSFAAAESVKFVPAGAYLQNYLVQRLSGGDVGRSSAATTTMILGEIVAALLGVMALSIGTLSTWVSFIVVGGAIVLVIALCLFILAPFAARLPMRLHRQKLAVRVFEELRRFRAGISVLMRPKIIASALLLSAGFVIFAGIDLYIVARALDIGGVTFRQTLVVTCFGLAFYVVLGSLEAAGVAAFVAIGVNKSAAVSAILVNRALGIIGVFLLSCIVVALLPEEWHGLFRLQPGPRTASTAE